MKFFTAVLMTVSFLAANARASDQIGTITQLEGTVKIFTHPAKNLESQEIEFGQSSENAAPSARALFEGEYYRIRDARVGDRVEYGNILRTAPGSKARVVFDNGDQYNVAPGTAYRVFWDKDVAAANAKIELMYGKLRGVIAKGGPRSHLLIRTKSATMGVRGTDFFIASGMSEENGTRTEETEVSIIRGQVEVAPKPVNHAPVKTLQVNAGYSAEVVEAAPEPAKEGASPSKKPAFAPTIELRKTTQEDLVGIQKSSEIQAKIVDAPKAVRALEEKAVKTTIEDVKAADPKLYAKLQGQIFKSTDEVNHLAIEKLIPEAPKAPPKRKPYKSEMEDLEGGTYEKYFKPATDGSNSDSDSGSAPAH